MNHIRDAAHDRQTTVRGLEVRFEVDGDGWAPGHDYRIEIPVGRNTYHSVTLNGRELHRWALILAEAATRFAPEGEMCPECGRTVAREGGALADHELDGKPCPGSGFDAEGPKCPACRGDIHIDLAGELWPTNRQEPQP